MRAKPQIISAGLMVMTCLAPSISYGQAAGNPPLAVLPLQPQTPAPPNQGYILGPEDVLQIEVLGRTDFSTKTMVGTDGKI